MSVLTKLLLFSLAIFCIFKMCTALDTISANQTIKDGETIISAGENFEMGFFSPSNSTNRRYFGIWYKKISTRTVVWVANIEVPVMNTSGLLTLNYDGVLGIRSSTNSLIWSSNSTRLVRNPVAQLLDTGNLVIRDVRDRNSDNFIWQSFDFPVDNLLPGMKFGTDLVTGRVRYFRSWKSVDDPSPGDFSVWIDTNGFPQLILRKGVETIFRGGPWNGLRFSGQPNLRSNPIYTFGFVLNEKEIYYHYDLISPVITRLLLTPSGELQRLLWIDRSQEWTIYLTPEIDNCDRYGLCGAYGSCNINQSPPCGCLKGFEPRILEQWNVADWSNGCRRKITLDCGNGDGFLKYSNVKLPDTGNSWFNQSMNLEECERECKRNCSCTAYANSDVRGGGNGCLLWFRDLIDTKDLTNDGQDIYIRMAATELRRLTSEGKDSETLKRVRVIIPVTAILTILLGILFWYLCKRRKLTKKGLVGILEQDLDKYYINSSQKDDLELPLFSLPTLLKATNNFALNNKIGEGGFGAVYKGELDEGHVIAVKRLSKTSSQGLEEFKNEVICIYKLQHRNLVKLLGCCMEGDEKMLVYEYMPNKGLDCFIFDETQSKLLDWPKRRHIIDGIARGLLYIHQDSRLRIIHRDLKPSNILLDSEMNPKISDFGTARSLGGNETEDNTNRVVGTYGYMSPEYAGDGIFSVKSDVFSFGVLLLEILSGRRNRGFSHQDHNHNLLGHAWRLHRKGRSLELVDESLIHMNYVPDMLRTILVALLCVQHDPDDRPNISSVVLMLGNEGTFLLKLNSIWKTENPTSIGLLRSAGPQGMLLTGQDIAIKRLLINSCQGTQEFKNKILLISKLQHRNLVKILGCCLQREERMIVYEYMPNKSLDSFLFEKEKRVTLSWKHRIEIAIGIAKGLPYLHHDSRLRIIHRDLKASNILLDRDLKPKISDFGTARIFGGDHCEGRTKHVTGTFGYMSPEYAIHGKFSMKSDVFSFGVLLMEIVSGKKNTKYNHPDHNHGLLGHAWLLWKEGNALEFLDENLKGSCVKSQVLRCIEVGLLCLQKFPKDRPTMSSVVFMLSNEGAILAKPKEPGFYMDSHPTDGEMSSSEVTTTMPEGR